MEQPVMIKIDEVTLEGALGLPQRAKWVVIFAHGSGSGLAKSWFVRFLC